MNAALQLSTILERQREAFLRDGPPSLEQRRAALARLTQAVKDSADHIADVISADFGSRSRHESLLAEVLVVCASIRHALRHLPRTARAPFNSAEDTSRLRSLTCIKDDACFRDQLNF